MLTRQGATPLTISEMANGYEHPWMYLERIVEPTIKTAVFPGSRIHDRILLLDGNHRSISFVRFKTTYAADLIVLEGPIDPRIMAKLAVFEK